MAVQFAAQQAELVYQQINSVTTMLDSFNARKAGLLIEAEKRGDSPRPTKIQHLMNNSSEDDAFSVYRPPLRHPVLPVEILEYVLRSVHDINDLLHVAVSNKHMNAVAVRIIYHTITLTKPRQSINCLRTLSEHPRLAILVRSLELHWQNFSHITRNSYLLALRTLCNTSLLSVLSIDVPSDFHPWNLSSCIFQLKRFSASFPCDNSLIQFLEKQPNLRDLTLRGFNSDPSDFQFNLTTFNLNPNPTPFHLSPEALPRLTRLRAIHAGPDIMESIIRGRPLKQISMPLYADCVCRSLDVLTLSSESIERLNIISFDPNAPIYLLEEIATRLPDLEALHIVILLAQCSEAVLEALAPSLRKFKALQYLTYMSATSTDNVSNESEQNIATMWHRSCPTLKTIILPMGKVWFIDNAKWMCLEDK